MSDPRFELVRSDAGWFARFIASNGQQIDRSSETYTRRAGALRSIELRPGFDTWTRPGITPGWPLGALFATPLSITGREDRPLGWRDIEVRFVDERDES